MSKLKPYPKYKDSGVECLPGQLAGLGLIPEDWEVRKLKYVTRLKYGDSLSVSHREDGKVPVFGSNGVVGYHDKSITESPCLIIGRKGSYGKVNFSRNCCYPIDTTYYIDNSCTKHNLRWLYYVLQTLKLDEDSRDAAVPGLNRVKAYNTSLILPPKDVQISIANYLDSENKKIDTYIKNLKKQIKLLKEYRQKIISQAVTCGLTEDGKLRKKPEWSEGDPIPNGWKDSGVEWLGLIPEGWEVRKLKYVVNKFDNKVDDSTDYQSRVLMENIESFTGKYISTDENVPLSSKVNLFRKGDVLFGKLRPYLAKVYLATSNGVCVTEFLTMRPTETTSEYLKNMLLNSKFICLVNSSTYGAKMPRASWDFIGNIEVAYPDKEHQEIISMYIDRINNRINKQIAKISEQIDFVKEYKQSLISKVVTGKRDV